MRSTQLLSWRSARASIAAAACFALSHAALRAQVASPAAQNNGDAMQMLHTANVAEIRIARLAQDHSTDARVRAFAQGLVRDHTAADSALGNSAMATQSAVVISPVTSQPGSMAATGSIGTTGSAGYARAGEPATGLAAGSVQHTSPDEYAGLGVTAVSADLQRASDAAYTRLAALRGAEFDRAFLQQQVDMHRWLLSVIENRLIGETKDAGARKSLADARGQVAMHLKTAEDLLTRAHAQH